MEMVAAELVEGKMEAVSLTHCVTGATGYVGSWLVKALLERGCMVHAAAEDPGNPKFYSILCAVNARMGSIALAHIEDICNAHIFLTRQTDAQGNYICCACSCMMSELVCLLVQEYPCSNIQRLKEDHQGPIPSQISSKKLRDLGLTF